MRLNLKALVVFGSFLPDNPVTEFLAPVLLNELLQAGFVIGDLRIPKEKNLLYEGFRNFCASV